MKTTKQMIEVMTAYDNGADIEIFMNDNWKDSVNPGWNWCNYGYRIKEQKKTITIEKWLIRFTDDNEYRVVETSDSDALLGGAELIKLLDTYKVEL